MAGIRIGGTAVIPLCSPPFSAFEGTDGDGDTNVYRACSGDPAHDATKITDFNDGGLTTDGIFNPQLSPDGTKILFELNSVSAGITEIWVVAATPGSTATQVLADPSNYWLQPFWGPDSDSFVCIHGSGGDFRGDIVATSVSAPGTQTVLKSADGTNSPFRPQYSPDGAKIVYLWDQDVGGTGHLRIMDADGSNDAALDTAVAYRFQGPQAGWSHDSSMIAYDDGASGSNAAYVILPDGTGKTQINANGDAAGGLARVSDRAWPSGDAYVVIAAATGEGSYQNAVRAELDGSNTTIILSGHGSWQQDYFRQVIVADSRIWFIESGTVLGSCTISGTGYLNMLTIDGAAMNDFSTGDGWFYN